MKTDNIIVDKSFDFAVRIVNLCKHNSILEEANEISKILSSITKTTRIGINS